MWTRLRRATAKKSRSSAVRLNMEALETREVPAAFTPGDIVIYRVGTGSDSLVNTGNAVFLDEYSPTGTLVQSIALPTTTSGANKPLIASGTATSEGLLTLSADGQYLLLTGYGTTTGGSKSLQSTAGTSVPRVVGRVDASGNIDTTTALADFADPSNPRGVASTNGTDLWLSGGTGGVRYTTFGATTSTDLSSTATSGNFINVRQLGIYDGQLYASSGSGTNTFKGVETVGTGLPTSNAQTITRLPGLTDTTNPSTYAFFLADLSSSVGGLDTLYVCDDGAGAFAKFSLVGGSWTSNGIVGVNADDYRGLTATVTGTTVTLFATRKGGSGATGGGELVKLVDSSGYNGDFSGTPSLLATAAANTAFRGVALVPASANQPPEITLPGGTVSYTENDAATVLDSGATVTDSDSADLDTGELTVDYTSGGTADDRLAIRNQGTGSGEVGVSGSDVTFEGTTIGSFSGGSGTDPLVVTLTASATPTAVQALVRNITFRNVSNDPSAADRVVRFVLTDGDGGTSAAKTKTVSVTAVNDPPTLSATPLNPTYTENGSAVALFNGTSVDTVEAGQEISQLTLTVSDVTDGASEVLGIDGSPVALTDGNSVTTSINGLTVTVALSGTTATVTVGKTGGFTTAVAAALVSDISYKNTSDAPTAGDRTVTLTGVTDTGDTANGGQNATSLSIASTATVVAVNDAPTLTGANGITAIYEDDTASAGTLVSDLIATRVTDPDGPTAGIAITAVDTTNGFLRYSTDGGTNWTDVGAVSEGSALLLAADASTLLRYVPNANFNGTAGTVLTFRAWDRTTGTAGGTADASTNGGATAFSSAAFGAGAYVISVADTPGATDAATDEDTTTTSGLVLTHNPVDGADINLFLITNVTNGTLFKSDGTTQINDGDFVTTDEGAAGLKFAPAANFSGTGSFQIRASGGDGTVGGDVVTATITVNPVNDPPTLDAPTDTSAPIGAEKVVALTGVGAGGDETQGLKVEATSDAPGVVPNPSVFYTGPDGTGTLKFTPTTGGTAVITVRVTDDNGTPGDASDDAFVERSFTVTVADNLPPVNTVPATFTTDEDVPLALTGISVTDPDGTPGDLVTIVSVPSAALGTLTATAGTGAALVLPGDGSTVTVIGSAADVNAALATLVYTPPAGANTATLGGTVTLTVSTTDALSANDTDTAAVAVNPVNDAPAGADKTVTILEDATYTFSAADFGFTDPNDGPANALLSVKITTAPGTGTLTDNGSAVTAGQEVAIADIVGGSLKFTPAANANGTGYASFTFQVRDDGGGPDDIDPSANTFTVNVTAVNDEPTATVPSGVVVGQDSGAYSQANFATGFVPGPATATDETGQTAVYEVTNNNNALFSVQPAIDAAGKLTFTPKAGAGGAALVKVVVRDTGPGTAPDDNTGPALTFTLTVTPTALPAPVAPITVAGGAQIIAIGSDAGTPSLVRVLSARTGAQVREFSPFGAYAGGVRVAVADLTGDGTDDVVAATASGLAVAYVYDGATGALLGAYAPFGLFPSGLQVATGDVDGDGRADLIFGLDSGPGFVFVYSGATGQLISAFDALFGLTTGVRLAAGDVTGDGRAEVVAAAGPGGSGLVTVYDGLNGALQSAFFALPGYTGEVNVAVGDLTGDGKAEVVTALTGAFGTFVEVFGAAGDLQRAFIAPTAIGQTYSAVRTDQVAVVANQAARIAAADINGDRIAELLLADPPGTGSSRLLVLNGATGAVINNPMAFDPLFGFGVFVDL